MKTQGFSETQSFFEVSARGRAPAGLRLADGVAEGLPLAMLDQVVSAVSPEDDQLRYAFVPRPTLHRRLRDGQRLSPEESARVARVGAVFTLATEVWGDEPEARAFLRRQHPLLNDRTPLDVTLATDMGARVVEKILGRLLHGTAA
ncbi:MAG: DUF2384 domain-containing protein [Microbacteriaceae bacterium]|nr:DUF2384 domain-containing protein [Burkholderiaceae bacterium]